MADLEKDNLSGSNQGALFPNTPLKFLAVTSIIGDKVRNGKNEDLGEIKDIMVDVTTGKIDYLVIEFGGFLGIGIKYFAVPFAKLKVDAEQKMFVFDQPKEKLEKAPGFDLEHWPDTNIHFEQAGGYWNFMGSDDPLD